jgi:hypothetical protein
MYTLTQNTLSSNGTSTRFSSRLSLLALIVLSSQLTGCFVSVSDSGQEDDYYYDDRSSQSSYSEDRYAEESFEEEIFEEEIFEETTTTTTTTTNGDHLADEGSLVESNPVQPLAPIYIFEETFESLELSGIDRVAVSTLNQWAIEWTPGSRCENLSGTGSVEVQSEADIGDQFEVEGVQHVRLDGRCGQDLNPARLVTSIADVQDAQTLTFYARVAETAPYAELMVEWNDVVVMNEPLLDVWAEYIIDLNQVESAQDALLSITALNPGVLIDHVRVE